MALNMADLYKSTLPKMELIPPRDAEVDEVFRQPGNQFNGRIIYTQVVPDREAMKASKRIKLDAEGKEIWKKNPGGEPLYPIFTMDVTLTKTDRYILQEIAGRHVKKIRNFEPTAQELAELKARDSEREWQRTFFREAAASGLSPAELIAKIKADVGEGEEVEIDLTEQVAAEMMAESVSEGPIERADDEENVEGITEAEKPKQRKW